MRMEKKVKQCKWILILKFCLVSFCICPFFNQCRKHFYSLYTICFINYSSILWHWNYSVMKRIGNEVYLFAGTLYNWQKRLWVVMRKPWICLTGRKLEWDHVWKRQSRKDSPSLSLWQMVRAKPLFYLAGKLFP